MLFTCTSSGDQAQLNIVLIDTRSRKLHASLSKKMEFGLSNPAGPGLIRNGEVRLPTCMLGPVPYGLTKGLSNEQLTQLRRDADDAVAEVLGTASASDTAARKQLRRLCFPRGARVPRRVNSIGNDGLYTMSIATHLQNNDMVKGSARLLTLKEACSRVTHDTDKRALRWARHEAYLQGEHPSVAAANEVTVAAIDTLVASFATHYFADAFVDKYIDAISIRLRQRERDKARKCGTEDHSS